MKTLISLTFFASLNAIAGTKPSFDRHAAEKVIQKNTAKFERCYSDELKKDPAYREGVVLSWNIKTTGEVEKFAVTNSTTNNPKLLTCLLETLKTLKFTASPDGSEAQMIYPMILSKNSCEN